MKKKFTAFLREENSLRELVINDTGKPTVDPAFVRQWQSKINLLALEADESVALILRIRQASVSILLRSDHFDQTNIERYLAGGLYLQTDKANKGLLVANSAASDSQDDSAEDTTSVTACFGLPIQWPDGVLFGVLCVLNYPGKALKPVYRNILSELRENIEQELAELFERSLTPEPSAAPAPAPAEKQEARQEAAPEPETPKAEPPAAAAPPKADPAPVIHPILPQNPELDALTSVYSRKKIEDILKHEFERARRYFKTFSVTMIDLNGLQEINDTLGQDAGDEILKVFASNVGSKIRETDSWGRWGGDAFVLVCPYADTVETQQMFTRIKPLVTRDMKALEAYADFSFGVSQYEPEDLTYQAIIGRAEDNMHQYQEMIKRKAFAEAKNQNASGDR